ncbi:MAG: DALR domain-containing protein, partial [Candidatus Bipolaricaulia bacterium]
ELKGREGLELNEESLPPKDKVGGLSDRGREFFGYLKGVRAEFEQEMDDDFNTAGGVGVIFELVRRTNIFAQTVGTPKERGQAGKQELVEQDKPLLRRAAELIRELGRPLGLFQEELKSRARAVIGGGAKIVDETREEKLINLLVEVRSELRAKREFELADRIRSRLNELGIELRDRGEGTRWSLKR